METKQLKANTPNLELGRTHSTMSLQDPSSSIGGPLEAQ